MTLEWLADRFFTVAQVFLGISIGMLAVPFLFYVTVFLWTVASSPSVELPAWLARAVLFIIPAILFGLSGEALRAYNRRHSNAPA